MMKTRSAPVEAPNIAAIVKARHHARILCPISEATSIGQQTVSVTCGPTDGGESTATNSATVPGLLLGSQPTCEEQKTGIEEKTKSRTDNARPAWSTDERRLFFQAVRLYGRNFTEITRFIRSRGNRIFVDWTASLNAGAISDHTVSVSNQGTGSAPICSTSTTPNIGSTPWSHQPGPNPNSSTLHPTTTCSNITDLNAPCGGLTREQVRFFYQQTWQKIRRYIKFPEEVPQHAREVYGLVNYSVIRTRIKKPLDHRLGEKLNELVHSGTTVIRHNGRRFLLRTPVCQALKQLNHVTAPNHEFLLPEDIWVELVPSTQSDLWRVIEAEQNPRLRLRVDINRQLSDLIGLVENKWQLAAERLQTLFGLPNAREYQSPRLLVRITPTQTIDGAIRLQEVARIRSGDMALRAYLERRRASKPDNMATHPSSMAAQPGTLTMTTDSNSGEQLSSGWTADCSKTTRDGPSDVQTEPTNPLTPTGCGTQSVASPAFAGPSIPAVTTTATSSGSATAELDLRETGKQLIQGVSFEAARGIKLLTIFLALGCPDRIRFEYSFVTVDEKNSQSAGMSSGSVDHTSLLTCPVNDPDGQGISNGLRRLLHLNASDYLLHREWAFRQSVLNTPAIAPIQPKTVTPSLTVAATHRATTKMTPGTTVVAAPASTSLWVTNSNDSSTTRSTAVNMPVASTASSSMLPQSRTNIARTTLNSTANVTCVSNILPSVTSCSTCTSTINPIPVQSNVCGLPANAFIAPTTALSTTDTVRLVVADSFSVAQPNVATTTIATSAVTVASTAPIVTKVAVTSQDGAVSSTAQTTPVISAVHGATPNLIMLPKAVGSKEQVTVVERRLDIPQSIPRLRGCVPIAPKGSIAPMSVPSIPQPKVPIPKYRNPFTRPMVPQPRTIQPGVPSPPPQAATQPKQSSLNAVKAFNSKRRQTLAVRGPRRGNGGGAAFSTASGIGTSSLAPRSLTPAITTAFSNILSGPTQLSVGLPFLFPAPPSAMAESATDVHSTTTATTTTETTSKTGVLPTNTTFIQGLSSLTPTVSVLNASSLLFGDGDSTLGTLLDPSASNQSSISAMSQDTLASLLNTICHPTTLPTVSDTAEQCDTQEESADNAADTELQTVDHSTPSQPVTYKCEDPMEQRGDWNDIGRLDFHSIGRFCPSASTPHLPPASPAFADISLTDSMAAAVMDTHDGELDAGDYEDEQVPSFPMILDSGQPDAKGCLESNESSGMPIVYRLHGSTDYPSVSSSVRPLLRIARTSSHDISTIDLNSLMHSIDQNSPPSVD